MAVEAVNIPDSDYTQQIIAMNENMLQLVQDFNEGQVQVVATFNAVITGFQLLAQKLQLVPIRIYNAGAQAATRLRYPPGVPEPVSADGAMPLTLADAVGFDGAQSAAAIEALIIAGAPDLLPAPLNASAQATRRHFIDYMGIYRA
ncbi:hypothetical protein B0H11DRAFT_1912690 [Mycena galericulata]|nr:hypothetical protein B0H11DRAFT_1912690 [Mycena galericulata]